jgi:type VI protein secretion system component VasK
MSKGKKVFCYILLGLALALLGWCFVSYIINPSGTTWTLNYIWSLLNQPLPIVGITSIALFWFVWNIVVFIRKNQPQKELVELKREHNEYKQESEKEKQELKEQLAKYKGYLVDICKLSTNQKIKNFGKELEYGRETIDSETKAN